MQTRILSLAIVSSLAAGMFALAPMAQAAVATAPAAVPTSAMAASSNPGTINCEMSFTLTGWSVFYKSASGNGMVTCDNGQTMKVVLDVTGGGLTFGHYQINDGHGDFVNLNDISQVLGSYAMATAHAGAVKSSRAEVLTNGTATLTITGTGNGWNIGVGFASFQIKRASTVNANNANNANN